MGTIGLDSWAVDLANVGPVYPFQGTEVALVVACVAYWVIWHIRQMRAELKTYEQMERDHGDSESIKKGIDLD